MRALVIEDERWRREVARASLQKAGFEVDLAQNKEEGLRLGRQGRYDAVIVDLGLDDLPDEPIRGLELITDLRRENHNLPIMIWSGFSEWETRRKGRQAGADIYVVKSSDMIEFIAKINAMIRNKKAANSPSDAQD